MGLLISIVAFYVLFRMTGFALRLCGALLGGFLSLLCFFLVGLVLLPLFSIGFLLPLALAAGAFSLMVNLLRGTL